MDMLKRIRDEEKKPVAILLDTKGPEIRTGVLKEGKKVHLEDGALFTLTTEEIEGDENRVFITYPGLVEDVQIGSRILIDDGLLFVQLILKHELEFIETGKPYFLCKSYNTGI